ncbi:retrovirus-related pol polyprotein from transposon TNT 1-94 [Tanacetum coccineum]
MNSSTIVSRIYLTNSSGLKKIVPIAEGIDNDIYSMVDACPNAYEISQQATRNRGKAIVNSSALIYDQELTTITEDDEMSKDKEIDKLMALISQSFMKIYKPTNNNLITSSNTSRATQDNTPRINKSTGYDNQRVVNVAGAKENACSKGMSKKPKWAKDAAYHKEKMLLCNQEEAGFQLNAKQANWRDDINDEPDDQELEAHYMYMAQIQEVTLDAADNSRPIFDVEPLQKVQNNDDNYNVFAIESEHPEQPESVNNTYLEEQGDTTITINSLDMSTNGETVDQDDDDDDDLDKEHDLLASLIEKLKCEIDNSKNVNAGLEKIHLCLKEEMVADLRYVNSLEHEVDTLNSQLDTQKTQFLNEIDRLSREYYYVDHMNAILGVYTEMDEVTNLQCYYLEALDKCERLEKELPKCRTMSKSFEALQKHAINLKLALQQLFLKEREQYFEIQDLKAQLQDKGIAISELKKLIEKMKGKPMETKFEKSSVIRQPNAFKSQRPSTLGKPTTFLDSLAKTDKVKFGNDHIAPILGYGDLVQGKVTIKQVYYIKGLNHNLFSVGQFYDADLEVAFRKSTCYICDLKGNDLLTGIKHETSIARTPEQNGIVERRKRTLVEAARTMLSAAKVPLDGDLDKMKEKGDACIFVGYSTQLRAYRVFNKRTRVIVETIHVNFDELPQMALDHVSSDPVPQCLTTALEHDSLIPNVSKSFAVTTADAPNQRQQQHTTPSTSTTVTADTPPLNIQTTPETTSLAPTQAPHVTATENINQAETNKENAQVEENEFINTFSTPEGIYFEESFASVAQLEAVWLFVAHYIDSNKLQERGKGFQAGKDFAFKPKASNVVSNGDNGTRVETKPRAGLSNNINEGVLLNTMGTNVRQKDTGKKTTIIASPNPFAALGVDKDEEEEVKNIWDESENLSLLTIRASTPAQTNQKSKGSNGILKNIDRIMGNLQFNDDFPRSFPIFKLYRISNHSPCVLRIPTSVNLEGCAMFHIVKRLKGLKSPFCKLLHNHGNLHEQVNKIRIKLDEAQKASDRDPSSSILREEDAYYLFSFKAAQLDENRIEMVSDASNNLYDGNQVLGDFVNHYNQFLRAEGVTIPLDDHVLFTCVLDDAKANFMVREKAWDVVGGDITCACIRKIIANRVKEDLGDIVSINQSAFIPSPRNSDNILLTQELIRNYHRRCSPPRCAFKVDIQKAYDTMDWSFLKTILVVLAFTSRWSNGLWFVLLRPLTLYVLMVTCKVGLKRRGRDSDDFQLVAVIMDALEEFKHVLGLVPSILKSTAFLCNVPNVIKAFILNAMPFAKGVLPVRYLGEMKKGKAKVAYDSVCTPKHEGGLGIRRIDDFNVALMATHIWSILTHRESLWVKLVHTYKLKGRSFWDIPCGGDVSWGWRKFLQIRSTIQPSIWHKINNGKSTSAWFDRWADLCPLKDVFSNREIARSSFSLDDSVNNLIFDGVWRWPLDWLSRFPIMAQLQVPLLLDDINDVIPVLGIRFGLGLILLIDSIPPRFIDVTTFVNLISKGKTAISILFRLVFAATSYYIWLERNGRLFKKTSSPDQIVDVIISMVRLKLVTFKFKKMSTRSRLLLDQWKISSYCIVHDGSSRQNRLDRICSCCVAAGLRDARLILCSHLGSCLA